jgi:hypothetical protein
MLIREGGIAMGYLIKNTPIYLTAKLTAKPTITSDFERTKANNKNLLILVERR